MIVGVRQVAEFHRFQQLVAQLISVNEQICIARTVASDSAGWTVEQKKLLLSIRASAHSVGATVLKGLVASRAITLRASTVRVAGRLCSTIIAPNSC